MSDVPTITASELVARIKAKLESKPHKSRYSHFDVAPAPTAPSVYALILGAGFSHGAVPLVHELMHQTIGDYYFPDQDQTSVERPASVRREDSARFWAQLNQAAAGSKLKTVELGADGLPNNSAAAYQILFAYGGADALLARGPVRRPGFVERLARRRADARSGGSSPEVGQDAGRKFLKGSLRYVLDPGAEHGYGSTGRTELNSAHVHLAALLESQQLGREWKAGAFCRTVFTTNFDTLLQNCLQMVNLSYRLTDRPENGLDRSDFLVEEGPIHLVYVHGSILRHNPASTTDELGELEGKNLDVLRGCLESRDVIAVGYGGWNDGLMAALRQCDPSKHTVYWCGVLDAPPPHVAEFLGGRAGAAAYVGLGKAGADGLMRALYEALVPAEARRDPLRRYREWSDLVWNRKGGA